LFVLTLMYEPLVCSRHRLCRVNVAKRNATNQLRMNACCDVKHFQPEVIIWLKWYVVEHVAK
jgi:hypothetical protein